MAKDFKKRLAELKAKKKSDTVTVRGGSIKFNRNAKLDTDSVKFLTHSESGTSANAAEYSLRRKPSRRIPQQARKTGNKEPLPEIADLSPEQLRAELIRLREAMKKTKNG